MVHLYAPRSIREAAIGGLYRVLDRTHQGPGHGGQPGWSPDYVGPCDRCGLRVELPGREGANLSAEQHLVTQYAAWPVVDTRQSQHADRARGGNIRLRIDEVGVDSLQD